MTNERKLIQSSSIIRQYNPSVTLIIHQKPRRPTICSMHVCMILVLTLLSPFSFRLEMMHNFDH